MKLQAMKREAVPLHAEVAAMLRHQIRSGELSPGTQVPALRELCEQLGVARMTVVQAMNSLEDEGLIERFSGRGTFVKKEVETHNRHTLHMQAEMSQLHSLVSQLEVSVLDGETSVESEEDGRDYLCMRRLHARGGKPFCQVDIRLDNTLFVQAPDRFANEIVVTVLNDLGVVVANARQNLTISYADFELAGALNIKVNSAVFRVFRQFYDEAGQLIYSANLIYPGDQLALEIEFTPDLSPLS